MLAWIQDVVFAYVTGIVAGAPLGLAAFWLTAQPESLTAAIACAMAGMLVARRTRRRRFTATQTAS
jgi:hypothetical protein